MCLQVGNLPVTVIPVYMAVVGCPISALRNTCYSVAPFQKQPITRCPTSALSLIPDAPPAPTHTHQNLLAANLGCLCQLLVFQLPILEKSSLRGHG